MGRVVYDYATDDEVLEAFLNLARTEGIIPALESAHAVAYVMKHGREWSKKQIVVINLSGRGDKDVHQVAQFLGSEHLVRDYDPREVPVMALSNAVLFPHSLLPLHIFELRYRTMLEHSLGGDRMFSVALMRPGISEASEIADLFPIASVGLIRACVGNQNGTSNLILQGLARIRLLEWTQHKPFRIARTTLVESGISNAIEADALAAKVKELCVRIQQLGVPFPANLTEQLQKIEDPEVLADVIAAAFVGEAGQRQQLLEVPEVCDRLRLLIQLLRGQVG